MLHTLPPPYFFLKFTKCTDSLSLLHSLQDFTDLTASSASFIPTVTAISTSPDLQWMVQPLISSVAPSNRAHPYSSSQSPAYTRPAMRSAASKGHGSTKRGRAEQVITTQSCDSKVLPNKFLVAASCHRARVLTVACFCADFTRGGREEKGSQGEE